ncbi:MAG: TonB family protein [Lentimicrobiaceae bacterium]|jgi:Ca-activated chloride channel family protein
MNTKLIFYNLFGTLPIILVSAVTMMNSSKQFSSPQALIPVKAQLKNSSKQETDPDKTLSPYFFVKSTNPDLDQLPLKATSAEVNIAGVIADVSVVQEYANEGKNPIEAIYVFPASTRAAVYSMKMIIGERTIVAKISEREKSRKDYEEAKQQGKSASLLEQERPNVFQMNVANIMPGNHIRVELRYTELLIPEDGVYEFVFPTAVGPRYSNQPAVTAPPREQWVSNPYTHEGEKPSYSFNIKCNLSTGLPVSDVKCSTHKTDIKFDSPSDASITLMPEEKQGGNRDFILHYRLAGNIVQSGLLLYPGKDENFFLAMIQPPKQVRLSVIPPREYVFIVDVSGSMHGYPLDISKKLLRDLIGNLKPTDRFNVLLFAGASNLLSETAVEANNANIEKAIRFIDREQGGGGTELLPALKRALSLKGTEGYARSFVIATDGYVSVEKEAFDLIRNSMDKANFFAFGIGTSVNRLIIEGLAHVGMGMPFVITKQEEATATALNFRQYVQNPVLTHISVSYNKFEVYDVEPISIPDVFSERPVLIFGKYRGTPAGKITIKGMNGEGEYESRLLASTAKVSESNSALRYLWARERIRTISDYASVGYGGDDEYKPEIIELGLKYNLLTAYTSFIAIDNDIRNKDGNSTTVNQPLPLPEDVSDYAVGNSMTLNCVAPMLEKKSGNYSGDAEMAVPEDKRTENAKQVLTIVEEMPEFVGGQKAKDAFFVSNLNYPKKAEENGISGIVYVSFKVDEKGNVSDVKVLRGIGGGCDEEAVRLIKLTNGKWKAGKQNGKAVKVLMNMPITFSLK